jgi:hypothetical protein
MNTSQYSIAKINGHYSFWSNVDHITHAFEFKHILVC